MKEKINRRPAANKHGGFSLIELLIVSIISIIVLWGAIDFFNSQQKVFRQQSLQARNQANVRMGLYYISKDLINAGFTGGPFGIETAVRDAQQRGITNFPVFAANSIDFASDPDFTALRLGNSTAGRNIYASTSAGSTVDALVIWANFASDGQATRLMGSAPSGNSTLFANTIDNFVINTQNCDLATEVCTAVTAYPPGVVIANFSGDGEYAEVSNVSTGSRIITTANPVVRNYQLGDIVAPVWKRVYYIGVINGERWLVRREYYAGNTHIDTKIAEGIWDMQVTFDIYGTTPAYSQTNPLFIDVDPGSTVVNPVLVNSVNVELTTITRDLDQVSPLKTVLMKRVKLVNLGLHPYLRGY